MEEVNFGYKKVNKGRKQSLVNQVFDSVSNKYDIMNDLMSLGLHRLWKKEFVERFNKGGRFLDLASGSGDIAISIMKRMNELGENFEMIITDINENMLEKANEKLASSGLKAEAIVANAEKLPFVDNSFDYCTISFGIRNCTDIEQVLKEVFRVLKPGGVFFCLEFSKPTSLFLGKLYDIYSFKMIPFLGGVVTKNREAYEYLVESIRTFPDQEEFKFKMKKSGFLKVSYTNLSCGIVAIHKGAKNG